MQKVSAWLFLLIALVWLLPLVGVALGASTSNWIVAIALALVGIVELKAAK